MRIAILGGGNGAHACAAHLALKGHQVNMFELPQFESNIEAVIERGGIEISGSVISGFAKLNKVTTNIAEAIDDVELIMQVVPAFGHRKFAETCIPYLKDGQYVVLNPGNGSSLEWYKILKDSAVKKDVKIAETHSLTYACRLQNPGHVQVNHACPKVWFAAMPSKDTSEMLALFKELYPSAVAAKNVLEAFFLNGNPIHHPTGTILNAGRIEYVYGHLQGNLYKTGTDFYMYREGLTPSVVRVAEALDEERLAICRALDLSEITTIEKLYEDGFSVTPDGKPYPNLYEAYHSEVFCGPHASKGPTSLKSRYITEDIPYGLVTWASIGEMLGIKTPTMHALIHLASILNKTDYWKEGRTAEKLGITHMTIDQLKKYLEMGEE